MNVPKVKAGEMTIPSKAERTAGAIHPVENLKLMDGVGMLAFMWLVPQWRFHQRVSSCPVFRQRKWGFGTLNSVAGAFPMFAGRIGFIAEGAAAYTSADRALIGLQSLERGVMKY
jgi:hypothetical protein